MKFHTIVLGAAVAALCGCITDTSGIHLEESALVIENVRLSSHLKNVRQICKETADGHLKVQIELQNDDSSDIDVLYRFQWFDQDGMLLEEVPPTWRRASAHGKDRIYLIGVSESKLAKSFRLVIR